MLELSRELRDRAVWVLARLSLAMLLALMGALFIGSAAEGHTSAGSTVVTQPVEPTHAGLFTDANPLGLVLVALILVGGVSVLLVGAFRPQRLHHREQLAELLRD
jgi:hypothetical protein